MRNPFPSIGRYFLRVLLGIDQLGNTLLGGAPDETISARSGRLQKTNRLAKALCGALDVVDDEHCEDAIVHEQEQRHQDKFYRTPR